MHPSNSVRADLFIFAKTSAECGPGWRDLLDRMCFRIRTAVQADGGSRRFTQIQEKYATVRADRVGTLSPEPDAPVQYAIDISEARSACSCEECGEEGRLYQSGDWLMTRCAAHAMGVPVETRPGLENMHIVSRFAAGEMQVVTCQRYDRKTDSFVDVDPTSLGIEED